MGTVGRPDDAEERGVEETGRERSRRGVMLKGAGHSDKAPAPCRRLAKQLCKYTLGAPTAVILHWSNSATEISFTNLHTNPHPLLLVPLFPSPPRAAP